MRERILILAIALVAGCYAPQPSGAARTTYVTMATVDGAFVGGVAALGGCMLAGGFVNNKTTDRMGVTCFVAGAVVAGAASLYAERETASEPPAPAWVVISIVPVSLVLGAVSWTYKALRGN